MSILTVSLVAIFLTICSALAWRAASRFWSRLPQSNDDFEP